MKTVTFKNFKNDFHGTETRARVKGGKLSAGQVKRIRKTLCVDGCQCSNFLGVRGEQDNDLEIVESFDGTATIHG